VCYDVEETVLAKDLVDLGFPKGTIIFVYGYSFIIVFETKSQKMWKSFKPVIGRIKTN